jgi:hypothetical protein
LEKGGLVVDLWSMKKRTRNVNSAVGIASLIMSTTSLVWIGGFQYSAIIHKMNDMNDDILELKGDIRRIDNRLDKMQVEFSQEFRRMDVRVNTLEQRKR